MIDYHNKFYIVLLTALLVVLSTYNIFSLIMYLNYISIIPLLFQLPMLFFIYHKKRTLTIFIKIWSVILLIGGVAGWINIIANLSLKGLDNEYDKDKLGLFNVVIQSLRVMVPIYFLMFMKESIKEIKDETNNIALDRENEKEVSV